MSDLKDDLARIAAMAELRGRVLQLAAFRARILMACVTLEAGESTAIDQLSALAEWLDQECANAVDAWRPGLGLAFRADQGLA